MRYSKHLSSVLNQHGFPQLSTDGIKAYFNVISIEGQIHTYKKIRDKLGESERFKYDLEVYKLNEQLKRVTLNRTPKDFLRYLLSMD